MEDQMPQPFKRISDDIQNLPPESKTFLDKDGNCWHPMSLRIGNHCMGCQQVVPRE